jgi:hypothetical protein
VNHNFNNESQRELIAELQASLGQSHTVCNPVTGLCFEQFFVRGFDFSSLPALKWLPAKNSALNVTVGFALPPKQSKRFANEVLVLGMSYLLCQ